MDNLADGENWYSRLFYKVEQDPAMAPYWLAMTAYPDLYKTPEDVEKVILGAIRERERPARDAAHAKLMKDISDRMTCMNLRCEHKTDAKKDFGRDGKLLHMSVKMYTIHKRECPFFKEGE